MSTGVRPTEEQEIRLSQIDARQIRRWRRARKRKELARVVVWAVGIFLWVCLAMWIVFGR